MQAMSGGSTVLKVKNNVFSLRKMRRLTAATGTVTLLSATSAGIAVPPVASAVEHVSDALSVLSARSPGVREAGALSLKGKRNGGAPRDAFTPDSAANSGTGDPRIFDSSADPAPIPAALDLPADPAAGLVPAAVGLGNPSPFGDVVPPPGPSSFTSNSIVPGGGGGGGGGGGVVPIGLPTPEPTPQPTPEPTPQPTPEPTPQPTPEPTPPPPPPPPPPPTPTPVPPGVPEPSQWAMLITAVAMMGGVLRRRKRSEATH